MPTHSWQEATRHGKIVRLINQDSQCIKVKENEKYRWLEIDGVMQSLMKLNDPAMPVLPPHQAMLEVLPADTGSGVALELGLGGGAMQRYFQKYRPNWQLTSVELNPTIIELYRDHFQLEEESGNQQQANRAEQAIQHIEPTSIDALLIDICTNEGLPPFLSDQIFWSHVSKALKPKATLAVNLIPSTLEEWESVTQMMRNTLEQPLGWIQVPGHLNMLVVTAYDG